VFDPHFRAGGLFMCEPAALHPLVEAGLVAQAADTRWERRHIPPIRLRRARVAAPARHYGTIGRSVAGPTRNLEAYLYKEPTLRDRINLLRQEQDRPRRQLAPVPDRSQASTRPLVAAKDRRIRELEARVKQLEIELAACRGKLYECL
jgi:hypothetical protein